MSAAVSIYNYPLSGRLSQNSINSRKFNKSLGRGTFGRVNRETVNSKGKVATKYFLSSVNFGENVNEVAVMKYLKGQPNIAQYIGLSDKNISAKPVKNLDFPAILMGAAETALDNKTIYTSWDIIYKAIKGVLHGYNVMHQAGIVHRDTKPANMLMTHSGVVQITDFGQARYVSDVISAPMDYYTGTLWWAPPEVVMKSLLGRGITPESASSLKAVDAWAVGCSLIDLLTNAQTNPYICWTEADSPQGQEREVTLHKIFSRMGIPNQQDEETMRLYRNLFQVGFRPQIEAGAAITPSEYVKRHRNTLIDLKNNNSEFIKVCEVIEGLMTYNVSKRWTIPMALEYLGEPTTVSIPPPLDVVYTDMPERAEEIMSKMKIFTEMRKMVEQTTHLNAVKYVVLDRAYTYFNNYIKDKQYNQIDIYALAEAAVLISAALFEQERLIGIEQVHPNVKTKIKEIIKTQQLLGNTRLDKMCFTYRVNNQELGYLNVLCFQYMLYDKYTKPEDVELLITTLQSKAFALKNLKTYPADPVIVQEISTAMGIEGGAQKRRTRRSQKRRTMRSQKVERSYKRKY